MVKFSGIPNTMRTSIAVIGIIVEDDIIVV
jgi:hypothetical protein